MQTPQKIILASGSKYRQQQLLQLGWSFESIAANVDEDSYKAKISDPFALVKTLSFQKAQAVAIKHPKALVIGSDQVAYFKSTLLGKPLTQSRAVEQLLNMSGQTHQLITGVCIIANQIPYEAIVETKVTLKKLTPLDAENYVRLDNPIDCAGAYKFEKGGPLIIDSIETSDPTSIIGLPLIALTQLMYKIIGKVPTQEALNEKLPAQS